MTADDLRPSLDSADPEVRTAARLRLVAGGRAALLDAPNLYVYVFHGGNAFGKDHWEEHWLAATEIFEGARYEARVGEIINRMPLEPKGGEGRPAPPPAAAAPVTTPDSVPDFPASAPVAVSPLPRFSC